MRASSLREKSSPSMAASSAGATHGSMAGRNTSNLITRCRVVRNDEHGIDTVAVVGSGTMGTGIAIVAARGGMNTLLCDVDEERARTAVEEVRRFLGRSVELGRLSAEQAQEAAARVRPTSQLADLAAAGLVIEAIF